MTLLPGLSGLCPPPLWLVRRAPTPPAITDLAGAVDAAFAAPAWACRIRPGQRVAVAVGSRGIANLPLLVACTVAWLRAQGAEPFIVPAMGSHGGGTAEGQVAVLARLGVDERSASAPIRSDMTVERIGGLRFDPATADYVPEVDGPLPVMVDALAWRDADLVLPIVRIKPHTGFRGRYESGICKMLAIGLAKHIGCAGLHREGYARFAALLPAAARVVLASGRVLGALAVVEDAADRTAVVEAVPAEAILAREPDLLAVARRHLPRLPLKAIDVLVVEQAGKDISGTGMDANITGRSELGALPGWDGPVIARIVVLALTAATKGNATGLGLADVITEACFASIDRVVTATNVLTSGSLAGGRIPIALPDADSAIMAAASCLPGVAAADARIVRIRDTLHLGQLAVSANLLDEIAAVPDCTVVGRFTGWPTER